VLSKSNYLHVVNFKVLLAYLKQNINRLSTFLTAFRKTCCEACVKVLTLKITHFVKKHQQNCKNFESSIFSSNMVESFETLGNYQK